MKNWRTLATRVVDGLEDPAIPFTNYLLVFVFIVFIRHFVECFSQQNNLLNLPGYLVSYESYHFMLAYLCITLFISLAASLMIRVPIVKVLRCAFPGMILLILSPVIDLIITQGDGIHTKYLMPDRGIDLWKVYSTFMMYGGAENISLGIKLEIAIILGSVFLYGLVKKASMTRCLIFAWVCYTLVFFWGACPFIIAGIMRALNIEYKIDISMFIWYYLFIDLFLVLAALYMADPVKFRAICADLRVSRIIYFLLTFAFGVTLALSKQFTGVGYYLTQHIDVAPNWMLVTISIIFASIFSTMVNNIYDSEIDAVSNKDRPLITGVFTLSEYTTLAYIFLAAAFLYASMAGGKAYIMIGALIGAYYFYSAPPFRLKRVPVLSKVVIAFNSFLLIILGYVTTSYDLISLPVEILLPIYFIGVTLSTNFIDLKDIAGDRAAGIHTLPTLLGEKAAKLLIGTAFALTIISYTFLFHDNRLLILQLLAALIMFYLINRKDYHDSYVVWFANACMATMIGYVVYMM